MISSLAPIVLKPKVWPHLHFLSKLLNPLSIASPSRIDDLDDWVAFVLF
jgi:hypothetical protein